MRASPMILIALVVILGAAPRSGRASEGDLPDLARGASLYSANCGRCHNLRGPSEYSDQQWPIVVTHMRVIAGLPGDQARSIEAFLRASNNPPPRRVALMTERPAAPSESGEVLLTRFGCRGCHKIDGQGGTIAPSLEGVFERRSEEWVRVQIQLPREHNPKTVMPQLPITDGEVAAIIEALRATHPK